MCMSMYTVNTRLGEELHVVFHHLDGVVRTVAVDWAEQLYQIALCALAQHFHLHQI